MYVQRNIEAHATIFAYSECVFVALGIQHAKSKHQIEFRLIAASNDKRV